MITEFTFVRHGETEANVSGSLQGQADGPLNANGLAQAAAVAKYLRNMPFDVIYSSDLLRAAVTAQCIREQGHADIPFFTTCDLREMNCGELENMTWMELQERYPEQMAIFYRDTAAGSFPGGESKDGFQSRVSQFLETTLKRHSGQRILLVSHGGALQRVFRHIAGPVSGSNLLPLAGNASISQFIYNDVHQAWQLTMWNFREHLKDLPQHQTLVL